MKQGMTLDQFALEITTRAKQKVDLYSPYQHIEMNDSGDIAVKDDLFTPNGIAHQQLAETMGIPKPYYERLLEDVPDLLAANVNHWLRAKPQDEVRLVRAIGTQARAFLSDRFKAIDDEHMAEHVLSQMSKMGMEIKSCDITESRTYIKATCPDKRYSYGVGKVLEAGISIGNSEVGMGSLYLFPFINVLACTNGMTINQLGMRRYHVGRRHDPMENVEKFVSNLTRTAEDAAFWRRIGEVMTGIVNSDVYANVAKAFEQGMKMKITGDVPAVLDVVKKTYAVRDEEGQGILRHLVEGGSLTKYGLVQAVTRQAQDSTSYDRATELETVGGNILAMTDEMWEHIAAQRATRK